MRLLVFLFLIGLSALFGCAVTKQVVWLIV